MRRFAYCKVVLATSLVWVMLDMFILLYFSECNKCDDKKERGLPGRAGECLRQVDNQRHGVTPSHTHSCGVFVVSGAVWGRCFHAHRERLHCGSTHTSEPIILANLEPSKKRFSKSHRGGLEITSQK